MRTDSALIVTAIKTWRREHGDGSYGLVEQHETGIFFAVDLVPVNVGQRKGVLCGFSGEFSRFEEACREADRATWQRGHVCDKGCHNWRRE